MRCGWFASIKIGCQHAAPFPDLLPEREESRPPPYTLPRHTRLIADDPRMSYVYQDRRNSHGGAQALVTLTLVALSLFALPRAGLLLTTLIKTC